MNDHHTMSGLAARIRSGETTAAATLDACLESIERGDGTIRSFQCTGAEAARTRATEIDRRIQAGEDVGPLAGVPIAIKDNIVTRGEPTTCGSRLLEHFRSPYDATVVARLTESGAVPFGKTRCDEFAMGSGTEYCAFGPVHNPWDTSRVPGGSSGGSAAAVAAGFCHAALGSDTGGSIRQPASLCGVVGIKPTYGRVSRYGLVSFGPSLDQIGPFARTVEDAALVLQAISGEDVHDSTTIDAPCEDLLADLHTPIEGLRVGLPREYLDAGNDDAVNEMVQSAVQTYRELGAEIVDVELPLTDVGIATYYVIGPAEASSNLARFDGIRYGERVAPGPGESLFDLYARSRGEGFGPEVRRRIMLGTYVLSAGYYDAYYKRALQVRRLIRDEFEGVFKQCDILLGPTTPSPAFRIGSISDPLSMYLCDRYTVNANIAGICGISLPGGFTEVDGRTLPLGLQLQAPALGERTLLRAARMFEQATDHHTRVPDSGSSTVDA
ncbi:MAG: Asp-tRNA(Asn)/Glu-tRNA(Gln) amidotransferase GatCAB subunit A [Phycisphaerae bacterium]|nr:Asp-tRNA(Asn)/Glu-tRNA(Gln) amidotransferase GatCAB subunit A [Phycisphaerae bacterium]|tara:strand:+ start:924 stop:2414 length:1491 start_codon:yes stop_codon:yes gene_type:complete